MKELPPDTRLQEQVLEVSIVLPNQKGTHPAHVAERIKRAIAREFSEELAGTTLEQADEKQKVNPLDVWEKGLYRSDRLSGECPPLYELHITRKAGRAYLVERYWKYRREEVAEYINEAEHQDGNAYWKQFVSLEQLDYDFQLFRAHRLAYIEEEFSETDDPTPPRN